jgi:radical SAM superfamily enzyme YgiQ (UPF0313 family)
MAPAKNILLVNPWIYDFTAYDFWLKPLGLLTVAALLDTYTPYRLSYIDCLDRTHPGLSRRPPMKPDGRGPFPKEEVKKPAILECVPRRFSRYGIPVAVFEEELASVPRPDAVLLTCTMTYWYPGVQAAVELVRRRFGPVPVILGGIYATLCPDHAKAHSGADVIASGPAERSLFPALRNVLGDSVPAAPDLARLDDLPSPAFEYLRDRTWLPVLSSRGCPFRCTFCASSLIAGRFEQRSAAAVTAEILKLHARFGTRHFAFYDDALLVHKDRCLVPLLEGIIAAAVPIQFHTPNGLHIRELDNQTARLFWKAGVRSLYLSLESVDEALVCARAPKGTARDLSLALQALEKAGYARGDINVYLIMGLSGQGTRSVEDSIRFVRGLGAVPRLALYSPIPGTEEWNLLARRGVVTDTTDPLLHNKIAFAYLKADFLESDFENVKRLLTSG